MGAPRLAVFETWAAAPQSPLRKLVYAAAGRSFIDPQKFVESIPFTKTREYVQAILRNANVYRQLYGRRSGSGHLAIKKPLKFLWRYSEGCA